MRFFAVRKKRLHMPLSEQVPPLSASQGGWTMVELVIAMALLTIGVVSFIVALTYSLRLAAAGHQKDIAMNAARQVIEQMRTYTISNAFATYNSNPDFNVEGLNILPGDTDGKAGKVIFPADSGNLVESQTSELMGMDNDLDLDGNGGNSDTVNPGNAIMLPVVVRIEWQGIAGDWVIEMKTLLTDR
jgi:type II secretory pathway pseudopilin PulG